MAWTEEQKTEAIERYQASDPTPANSTEIVKEIAEDMEQSANGVRMVLIQAGVYLKKDATADKEKTGTKAVAGEGAKRVSKESQVKALREAIEAKGATVDEDILSKLTGKAAAYFAEVLAK